MVLAFDSVRAKHLKMSMQTPAEIQLLPSQVIDQIAAGEVVERPAHLVKELIENSIDAHSTKIEIDFSEGGKRVLITDNGTGMSAANLTRAFERHATSKISQSEDLWKLKTFGFRGEALASLAAVSRINVISKTTNCKKASRLAIHFGEKKETDLIAAENGTQIQVLDLFENLPARKKFLKTDGTENQQIRQVIKALALANPQIEFRWMENRTLMGFWPAVGSHKERAEQILEISSLYQGSYQKGAIKVHAVMASPEVVSKTAKNIWIFAQNRWIQDRALQTACLEAYRNLLMHGEYPTCCVWIDCDPAEIDVNVHPSKSQVKFANSSDAFRAVFHAIRDELETGPWLVRSPKPAPIFTMESAPLTQQNWTAPEFDKVQYKTKSFVSEAPTPAFDERKKDAMEVGKFLVTELRGQKNPEPGPWSRLQVLGQAAQTYLVCQSDEAMVLIDQHAAHERVAFERLMRAWKEGKALDVQNFLFPLSIDLSEGQIEVLATQHHELQKIGVQIEVLGPKTLGVISAPHFLKDKALAQSLDQLSQEILEQGPSFVFEKKIADLFASMACHSVVRAGQPLTHNEIRELLEQMDEFPLSGFCPHGRPVSVEMSFAKLEKDFGRKL